MTPSEHKDLFSTQANLYAAFRPTYPKELYDFIFSNLETKQKAWDYATGNGQVAGYLASHFDEVYATDISQQQLNNAIKKNNIFYSVNPAEKTAFEDQQFDLITVAQALHWFECEKFYKEAKRVGKPGSLLAIWGYALLYIQPDVDEIIMNFYNNVVGPYWDEARRLVEEEYRSLSFPFKEIESPKFDITATWTLDHLAGYFESWSATQKYIKSTGHNPVPDVLAQLKKVWNPHNYRDGDIKPVRFPVFLKLFRM
ncbi:MAG TPA: methyltransferase domain-containing protein [Chryseolinea sp.]|nr:methyltransferase domain-containing protein [Chryseolinea sp.]